MSQSKTFFRRMSCISLNFSISIRSLDYLSAFRSNSSLSNSRRRSSCSSWYLRMPYAYFSSSNASLSRFVETWASSLSVTIFGKRPTLILNVWAWFDSLRLFHLLRRLLLSSSSPDWKSSSSLELLMTRAVALETKQLPSARFHASRFFVLSFDFARYKRFSSRASCIIKRSSCSSLNSPLHLTPLHRACPQLWHPLHPFVPTVQTVSVNEHLNILVSVQDVRYVLKTFLIGSMSCNMGFPCKHFR